MTRCQQKWDFVFIVVVGSARVNAFGDVMPLLLLNEMEREEKRERERDRHKHSFTLDDVKIRELNGAKHRYSALWKAYRPLLFD